MGNVADLRLIWVHCVVPTCRQHDLWVDSPRFLVSDVQVSLSGLSQQSFFGWFPTDGIHNIIAQRMHRTTARPNWCVQPARCQLGLLDCTNGELLFQESQTVGLATFAIHTCRFLEWVYWNDISMSIPLICWAGWATFHVRDWQMHSAMSWVLPNK